MAFLSGIAAHLQNHLLDPLMRNSYFLMANAVVNAGSGFLFWLVAARLLPVADVGIGSAIVGAILLASLVGKLGLDFGLLRLVPQSRSDSRQVLVVAAFTGAGGASFVAAIAFLGLAPWVAPELAFLRASRAFTVVFAATVVAWTYSSLVDTILVADRRADVVLSKNILHAVIKLALLVLVADAWGPMGLPTFLIGSVALTFGIVYRWFPSALPQRKPTLAPPVWRALFASSGGNYAVALSLALPLSFGSLFFLHIDGPAAAAQFYVLWMFGSLAMLGPTAFGQTLVAEMARTNQYEIIWSSRAFVVTIGTAAIVLVGGSNALPLFGEPYETIGWLSLLPFALSAIPGYIFHARLAQLRTSGQQRVLVLAPAVAVASFVSGLWLLTVPAEHVGWLWLSALVAGAAVGFSVRLKRPQFSSPTT